MAGNIPQPFIDDLLQRVDIIDLIQSRVPLKKAGHEYQACCPFHTEKTPSFTVSPKKQFYHCFGCGAHGSAIGFLMAYDRLSFPEAIEELAAQQGLTIPRDAQFETGPDRQPLYDLLARVAAHYARQLRSHPDAPRAVDYLKQRGLTGTIAARYQLGFAPPGWDNLLREFGPEHKHLLHEAGLINQTDGRTYDRLRDRIVFPIRDGRGRVIGFGGRLLGEGKPKYLNSPETPVFHKGQQVYGLYEVRQTHRQPDHLIVVEGYLDVIALAQHGIDHAVATLGTATTSQHLHKLYRTTPKITFCFDGDRAGREAAWKALQTTLPLMQSGRQARFLFLPDGEDPDSLVHRQGAAGWEAQLAQAQPLSNYLFNHLEADLDLTSLDDLAQLAERAKPLLSQLPVGTYRTMMQQALEQRVGVKTPISAPPPDRTQRPARRRRRANTHTMPPMRKAVALVLQHPSAAQQTLPDGWEQLQAAGIETLRQLITQARQQPDTTSAQLVEKTEDPTLKNYLAQLAISELAVEDDAAAQLQGILRQLIETERRQAHADLLQIPPGQMTATQKAALRALYERS
ncbi:MAG: DNA primase [Pseudomonadota bacterium]